MAGQSRAEKEWYREWKKTADANSARGDTALDNGNVLTARSNWLRAVNYYLAAAFPYDLGDTKHQLAIENMRAYEERLALWRSMFPPKVPFCH